MPLHPHLELPAKLTMGPEARGFVSKMFEPTPLPGGSFYRWTASYSQVRIGSLVKFPLPRKSITIRLRASTGRPQWPDPIKLRVIIDRASDGTRHEFPMHDLDSHWRDYLTTVDASLITTDTVLLLDSTRHRVEGVLGPGQVGIALQEIEVQ
jgi:hypothetical protein